MWLMWVASALIGGQSVVAESALRSRAPTIDYGPKPPGAENSAARPSVSAPEAPPNLAAYLDAREATPLGWSPKGQLLIATRFGDTNQLHLVDGPLGQRRQLTFLNEPITRAAFSPDPGRAAFMYLADAGGDERTQIYYLRIGEPTARRLTDGKSVNTAAIWSNSGHDIAFASTARDGASFDIDLVTPEGDTLPRLLMSGNGAAWLPLDWSPDDRKLLLLKQVSSTEGSLYTLDVFTNNLREVDPASGKSASVKGAITGARFSIDGQGVYWISNRDSEYSQLYYTNTFSGEKGQISASPAADIDQLILSRDGHYLAFVSHENGSDKLNLLDLRAHRDLTPPKLPGTGLVSDLSFDPSGNRLVFSFESSAQPRDAYVLDIAADKVERWTSSEPGALDIAKFVSPRFTHFPSFDREAGHARQIPVYVYEPRNAGPHPVLIVFQGELEKRFQPKFDPWLQYLVNELGFVVVAPHLRGAAGYGKSFQMLDHGLLREDAIKDSGALLVWLRGQNTVDAKHILVSGDGYGSYLALAALVNYGDHLQGGVVRGAISDFPEYLSHSPPYTQNQLRAELGDERDPDIRAYLRRISPLTNIARITTPLMIAQGVNDPQVLATDTEALLASLRSKGVQVWYLQADEGREFLKRQNRDAYWESFARFLTTCCPSSPSPGPKADSRSTPQSP